ncbi:MAG: glycosyltransferase [Algoriphagus sp.]|uniref:glycosyltransferase family 2 protein n=1 Tax=Algoriphagus sp. TaxID=1872435 RepID=UPI0027315FFB|nr:glycosyltransferase [Algoriphagus sp.]MDP2041754.1 glycosyltransferase [Algoriphagus sp.]MDP3471203.1 glycosyltransferase [Algoriphagus sp.]
MPAIAVIIPTYNRPDSLKFCLKSLQLQTLSPSLWEVVVVNDGGCDIEGIVSNFGKNFRYVRQENSGPARARNLGVSIANSEIITFLDDDCRANSSWLENILKVGKEGIITGGKVINSYTDNLFSESNQLLIDFLYQFQKDTVDQFFTSNNFSLYKSDFDRFGGFNNSFSTSAGEDREFCVRLKKNGMKLIFDPQIIVEHDHFMDLKKFIKLHKKYGRAAVLFRESANSQEIRISRKPKLSFYKKLFLYPFTLKGKLFPSKLALSFCLILSQICVAWGFLEAKT